MTARTVRVGIALVLELAALALLVSVSLGHPWPAARDTARIYVLADRSASVPTGVMRTALGEIASETRRTLRHAELYVIDFAGRSGRPRRLASAADTAHLPAADGLMPDATDAADAIRGALTNTSGPRPAALVIVSDGNATAGDTTEALRAAARAGIPVLWRTAAAASTLPRIAGILAPARAYAGQTVTVAVRLAGVADRPLRLALTAHDGSSGPVATTIPAGPLGLTTLQLRAHGAGSLVLDAQLADPATPRIVDERKLAAVVDVLAPADVLFVADGPSALAHSLQTGGWTLAPIASRELDGAAAEFGEYAAVVLDDVPATAARAATWDALAAAVRDRGTGLLVLGGARSFAAGSYRDSRLEDVLPVLSRPAALGDATALAFLVDKSGSMGESAAGVDKFRLAQRAVVETAATLTERDSAALVVFDVTARTLLPLQPAPQFNRSVAAKWAAQPRGGTRIAPAIETAVTLLESAPQQRRLMVLVTDGFLDSAPTDALRARLSRARIDLVALAVGPDADASALARLVAPGSGTVLRVGEAAELPALMRAGVEMQRAPIERGAIAARPTRSPPFDVPHPDAWPPVSAYAVTSLRPDAVAYLESARGDPLVAYRQAGLGRSVVVTCGLGPWTPEWLRWRGWPSLAGGLVEWVESSGSVPGLAVHAFEDQDGLRVDVDAAADGRWVERMPASVHVRRPSGRDVDLPLAASGPGRASAVLPDPEPGLYTFNVAAARGGQRATFLRQPVSELGRIGPSPEIPVWKRAGLIHDWSAADLARVMRPVPTNEAIPYRPILLALALFLVGVLVDRLPAGAPGRPWRSVLSRGGFRRRVEPAP